MSFEHNLGGVTGAVIRPDNLFFGNVSNPFIKLNEDIKSLMGGSVYRISNGKDILSNVFTRNPILNPPNVAGMKYFGQDANPHIAMDQIFPKPVGKFASPDHASGLSMFRFNTDPNFQNVTMGSAFGITTFGSQFTNVPGVKQILNGGFLGIVMTAITDLINRVIPSNVTDIITSIIPGNIPFVSTLISIATSFVSKVTSVNSSGINMVMNAAKTAIKSLNTIISAATTAIGLATSIFGSATSLLSSAVSNISSMISGVIGGQSLTQLSSLVKNFCQSSLNFLDNITGSKFPNLHLTDAIQSPMQYLKNMIDKAVQSIVPGGSTIVTAIMEKTDALTQLMGGNIGSTITLQSKDTAIQFMDKLSAVYATASQSPFSSSVFTNGSNIYNDVQKHIQRINSGKY